MKYLEKRRCEGIIYMVNIDGNYECYDGYHRYCAIVKSLKKDSSLELCKTILFILKDKNKVKEHFKEINKCDPVSEIYFDEPESEKRKIIEMVKEHYMVKYKNFFMTSKNPRIPNENPTRFVNRLEELYDEYKPKKYKEFKTILEELNIKIKTNRTRLSPSALNKCETDNFYLFSVKNWHLE